MCGGGGTLSEVLCMPGVVGGGDSTAPVGRNRSLVQDSQDQGTGVRELPSVTGLGVFQVNVQGSLKSLPL